MTSLHLDILILDSLSYYGGMCALDFCDLLGIHSSSLLPALDRLQDLSYVSSTIISQVRYYSVTPSGISFAQSIKSSDSNFVPMLV